MFNLLLEWLPTLILGIITVVMVLRDPRRMRCAIFLLLTLGSLIPKILAPVNVFLEDMFPGEEVVIFASSVAVVLLLVLGVAAFMIVTGLILIHREGFGLAHSLSLLVGLGMHAYVGAVIVAVVANAFQPFVLLLLIGVPIFLYSFTLVAYLLYSGLYGFVAKHWLKTGQCVVVLGSGLIGDKVPPLLAARVNLGVQTFSKAQKRWPDAALVMSGGKGSDEVLPEGTAMLRYAEERGLTVPEQGDGGPEVFAETRSVSTRQNLLFSQTLLRESGRDGPWTVVTSDFHSFRAANLMSRLKIAGNAIGARSTVYFWMSAKLREFIAILADNKRTTIVFSVLSLIPLFIFIVSSVVNLFS